MRWGGARKNRDSERRRETSKKIRSEEGAMSFLLDQKTKKMARWIRGETGAPGQIGVTRTGKEGVRKERLEE